MTVLTSPESRSKGLAALIDAEAASTELSGLTRPGPVVKATGRIGHKWSRAQRKCAALQPSCVRPVVYSHFMRWEH